MIAVKILEDDDIIYAEDWCRPLQIISMSGGMSDSYSFKSCYSGTPENNAKWVKVKDVIGSCWFGKKVKKFNNEHRFEFVRGDIPEQHRLNMRGYNSLWDMEQERKKVSCDFDDDIPF